MPRSDQPKRKRAASVKQLNECMNAGLEAARSGSQQASNVKRRIINAVAAKAEELGVVTPSLTDKIIKRLRAEANGEVDLLPDVDDIGPDQAKLDDVLNEGSDFTGKEVPHLRPHVRRKYQAKLDELPPPPKPSQDAKDARAKKRAARGGEYSSRVKEHNKPPLAKPGRQACAEGSEVERRVNEIVRRMGLGATRSQIKDWAKQNWTSGTSSRNVDEYIAAAQAVLRTNWQREREDFMIDLLEQYQVLAGDARANDQLGTALGCLNSMAKLANMGGFSQGQPQ